MHRCAFRPREGAVATQRALRQRRAAVVGWRLMRRSHASRRRQRQRRGKRRDIPPLRCMRWCGYCLWQCIALRASHPVGGGRRPNRAPNRPRDVTRTVRALRFYVLGDHGHMCQAVPTGTIRWRVRSSTRDVGILVGKREVRRRRARRPRSIQRVGR